jgi:hypothetical protein
VTNSGLLLLLSPLASSAGTETVTVLLPRVPGLNAVKVTSVVLQAGKDATIWVSVNVLAPVIFKVTGRLTSVFAPLLAIRALTL